MLVIPAIDLKQGKCVRLRQGRMEDNTVYSEDPVAVAARWVEQGARRIHIVDLDGAMAGKRINHAIVERIARAHPDIPVQVGGGIRDEDTVCHCTRRRGRRRWQRRGERRQVLSYVSTPSWTKSTR